MLAKGIILGQVTQVKDNSYELLNRYNVRIPVFEAQGSNEQAIFECGLIFQPGNNLGYETNDVVVVGFENNDLNSGLILGKLYTEESSSEYKSESNPFNLKVSNSAILPQDTTVGGLDVFSLLTDLKKEIAQLTPNTEGNYININLYKHTISYLDHPDIDRKLIIINNRIKPYADPESIFNDIQKTCNAYITWSEDVEQSGGEYITKTTHMRPVVGVSEWVRGTPITKRDYPKLMYERWLYGSLTTSTWDLNAPIRDSVSKLN